MEEKKDENVSKEVECPIIDKESAKHHHPSDCSKFIMCNGTIVKIFRCPEGFLYDRYRTKCREGSYVDCGINNLKFLQAGSENQSKADTSKDIVDRTAKPGEDIIESDRKSKADTSNDANFCLGRLDGFYKFTSDCNLFYKCSLGTTKLKRCPEGLLFNDADEVCDWPKHVHC